MATKPVPPVPTDNESEYDAGHVPITEEFDDRKHTATNPVPIVIALVILAIIVGAAAYMLRAKPIISGRIDEAYAVDVASQHTVLATVQITIRNITDKPLTLRNVTVTLTSDQNSYSDDSASVVDFERYFNAFPELRLHSIEGIARGTKIPPGAQVTGSVIVSFPVTKDKFDKRSGLSTTVKFDNFDPIEFK